MISWAVVHRECKLHFRSTWTYTFIVMFSIFTALIMYVSGDVTGLGQYTKTTGTMMNLLAYFLPLLTLVSGAFSLTMEKEEGSWHLLFTYPISATEWVIGKFVGMAFVLLTMLTCAFGSAGLLLFATDRSLDLHTIGMLYLYALCIVLLFLAAAVCIGGLSKNRWQALIGCIGVWVVLVLAWPVLLISILHQLPFYAAMPLLQIATLFNPLEFTRIFFTIQLGGGAVFGTQYAEWVTWLQQPRSAFYFVGLALIWIAIFLSVTILATRRGRYRGA